MHFWLMTMMLAAAAERPLVTVSAGPGQERAVVLLGAELERLGFRVGRLAPTAEVSRGAQLQQARASGSVALLRLVPAGAAVEVWVTDRLTGKTLIREYALEQGGRRSDDTVAIGAVELLRASLLELTTPQSARPEVPPPVEARVLAPAHAAPAAVAEPARLTVGVAGAALFAAGGQGPSAGLDARASLRGWSLGVGQVGVRLSGLFGLTDSIVSSGTDRAALTSVNLGLQALWTRPLGEAWAIEVGLGAVASLLSARGASVMIVRNASDAAWSGGAWASAGLVWWVASGIGLRVQADLLALAPVQVQFASQIAARWGLPIGVGSLGVVVAR